MTNTKIIESPIEKMYQWEAQTPDKVFLRQAENLQWKEYSWRDVANQVRKVASYILSKDYAPGSRIAIWSGNSKDWVITDLAIMLSGHISVPIYPGQDIESANYILGHSEAEMMFVGAFDMWSKFGDVDTQDISTVAMLTYT